MAGAGLYLSCFLLSIGSALMPWLNGEVLLLSFSVFATSRLQLALLVLLASTGQMSGKCILYWLSRRTIPIKKGRLGNSMNLWKERLERSPSKTIGIVFVSALTGIPPFYVITILSGAFRLHFGRFIAIGIFGRLLHFGVLILIPQFGIRLFHAITNH